MDERILTILKEVARGETCCDDMASSCLYCSGDENYSSERIEDINHKPECPIMLARAILREMGTPLCLYKVTHDRVLGKEPPYPIDNLRMGYTVDEIRLLYQHGSVRNVRIEYVKDM